MKTDNQQQHPIGLLDSGVGALPIQLQCRTIMPYENYILLADMARLPYGTKSKETVKRYALQAAGLLVEEGIKLLVCACNTISAQSLPELKAAYPSIPCIGVIETGAKEAAEISTTGHIVVLATDSTERSGSYSLAIKNYRPDAQVTVKGCNLMVSLAEQGWHQGPEAEMIIARYLKDIPADFDTLVLGCTHFGLLAATIRRIVGPDVKIVNSAATTALAVQQRLQTDGMSNDNRNCFGHTRFLATESPECFAKIAKPFLGEESLPPIEHVDIPNLDRRYQVTDLRKVA